MKPYQQLPIVECREPLVPIPLELFAVEFPHPYQKLGAPYGSTSPFCLRQRVLDGLLQAQVQLQQNHPNWRIQIFDAYRPVAVQQFMVDYTFTEVIRAQGLTLSDLTQEQRQASLEQVYQIWAVPSQDPATPPPHSTGAAVDITLVDDQGQAIFMGSPIDEISPRSHPDYFASIAANPNLQQTERDLANLANQHRQLLQAVMISSGFQRHPCEWWHFSLGDQMWAWLMSQEETSHTRLGQTSMGGVRASGLRRALDLPSSRAQAEGSSRVRRAFDLSSSRRADSSRRRAQSNRESSASSGRGVQPRSRTPLGARTAWYGRGDLILRGIDYL